MGYSFLKNSDGKFPEGIYSSLTEKEGEYLRKLKPLVGANRLYMGHWHQNENWRNKTEEQNIHECKTTHCMAGWIQIFEKDAYNNISAEECGIKCAPNLSKFFHVDNHVAEKLISTFVQD